MPEYSWNGVQASMRCWFCKLAIGYDNEATLRFGVVKARPRVGVPMHGECEEEWYMRDEHLPPSHRRAYISLHVDEVIRML